MASLLSPKKLLPDCPQWPTMQWLADPVVQKLNSLVGDLHSRAFGAGRQDVVGALVLGSETSGAGLWELIQPYKVSFAPPHSRRHSTATPVMLRLPSPISLRVDCMVEAARQHGTVYRHDLIGALIMAAPETPEALEAACSGYRQARAERAAVRGQPKSRVLKKERPRPGPRRR